MADYFIRIYVPEELNDQDGRGLLPTRWPFRRTLPEQVQIELANMGISKSSVEWDIQ
jgi:hypothetical protein